MRQVHPLPRLLEANELCGLLGCDFEILRTRVHAGELPEAHEMPNGSWLYRADDYAGLIDLTPEVGPPPPMT